MFCNDHERIYARLHQVIQTYFSEEQDDYEPQLDLSELLDGRKDLVSKFMKVFLVHDQYGALHFAEIEEESDIVNEVHISPSSGEWVMDERRDYAWMVGNDLWVTQRRLIDSGVFGEVHEVDRNMKLAKHRCMITEPIR